MLLAGWRSFDTTQAGERCVSNEEMREALRRAGDAFRRRVLWYLRTWSREDRRDGVPKLWFCYAMCGPESGQ